MVRVVCIFILSVYSGMVFSTDEVSGEKHLERLYNQLKHEERERDRRFGEDTVSHLLPKDKMDKTVIRKHSDKNENTPDAKPNAVIVIENKNAEINTDAADSADVAFDSDDNKSVLVDDKRVSKYSKGIHASENNSANNKSTSTLKKSVVNNFYMPPMTQETQSLSDNGNVSQSFVNTQGQQYGIKRNTWAKARLVRKVTSADSTGIELILEEDIIGKRKVLRAGTVLFGGKSFNSQTRRLESFLNEAIDPEGHELVGLSASVYDINKISGLSGVVTRNSQDSVNYSVYAGLASASNATLQTLSGVNPISEGVLNGSKTMLDLQKGKINKPSAFITVSPKNALIRFDKSF